MKYFSYESFGDFAQILYIYLFPPIWRQIFSQRQSFIKFPIIRGAKGSRASYCLACLISLVEQVIVFFFYKLSFHTVFDATVIPFFISATDTIFEVSKLAC